MTWTFPLRTGNCSILIDTGAGSGMRLQTAGYNNVSMVLYTHFHNDHISAFGDIMVNRTIQNAQTPMRVMGPKGTTELVAKLLAPYELDTEYRVAHHAEKYPRIGMTTDATDHEPGTIYDEDGLKIIMFNVDHSPIEPAVGYRIEYAGKSVVVSGDTTAFPGLADAAKDADIFVYEAMNGPRMLMMSKAMARANPRLGKMIEELVDYHATNLEVARIAKEAGVKKLVLTHLVPSIPPTDAAEKQFVKGMAAIYDGPIIVGRDLMTITP